MVKYNPKDWFTFVFRMHKADTVRALMPMILAMIFYTLLVAILEKEVLKLSDTSSVKNLPILHSLLGFAISMLLVFRTNAAYDRWWEGRKLWGALVNNSRNLALKMAALLPIDDTENRSYFRITISSYSLALYKHLRHSKITTQVFDGEDQFWKHISNAKHVPNQIAYMLNKKVVDLKNDGQLTGEDVLYISPELQSFTDICGACERIKNTPIPFSYNSFLKKFIFIYVMTLPFGLVFSLGYLTIPVVALVFYALASLELIAEEIEDPFGTDANDLPTEQIAQNISKHVAELI